MPPPDHRRERQDRRLRDLTDQEFRLHMERALYDDDGNSRMAAMERQNEEIIKIVTSAKMLWAIAVFLGGLLTPILAVIAYLKGK